MATKIIPTEIRDFIVRHIDSVAQLEALLLLRAHPDEHWTAKKIAQRLYVKDSEIAADLALLCRDGLLTAIDGEYKYGGVTPENRALIDGLALIYARHLIPVTNMIHANPRRIREFADAFKLRKDAQ